MAIDKREFYVYPGVPYDTRDSFGGIDVEEWMESGLRYGKFIR